MMIEAWLKPVAVVESLPAAPVTRTLPFLTLPQEATQWCWAAVSIAINRYYVPGSTWTQCRLVDAVFGLHICCGSPTPEICDRPHSLSGGMQMVGALAASSGGAAVYPAIVTATDGGRPVGIGIQWFGGGSHVVTAYGYWFDPDVSQCWMIIGDPYWDTSWVNYAVFPTVYCGGGIWIETCWSKPPVAIGDDATMEAR